MTCVRRETGRNEIASNEGFNNWNWGSFGASVGLGALGGATSFGIGSVANSLIGTSNLSCGAISIMQAGMHASFGGALSQLGGGSFGQGALSAGFGSAAGSLTSSWGTAGQLTSGAASGAFGSYLAGGDPIQGAGIGLITVGLNHLAHSVVQTSRFKIDLRISKNVLVDFARAYNEAYADGDIDNLYDFVEKNSYGSGKGRGFFGNDFDNIVESGGHKFRVRIKSLYKNLPSSYYDTGPTGFGYLDYFGNYKASPHFFGGFPKGFYITSLAERTYLVQIGANSNSGFKYLRSLFKI